MLKRDKAKDLKKLSTAFFNNLEIDTCEYGGIGLDSKRPFGNSCVEEDIFNILGIKYDNDDRSCGEKYYYVRDLYFNKLIPYLKKSYGSAK